jgi:cytochrome c peroxidase
MFFAPIVAVILVSATFFSCKKDDSAEPYQVFQPSNFPAPAYDLEQNPVTKAGFELGRKLFYDPILSRDSTIACADCHISYSAFSHPQHVTSHGIDGLLGRRNALPVQNLIWQSSYFWDGGVGQLDLIPLNAITNAVEMDESPPHVVAKLNRHPQYPALFRAAFAGGDSVTGPHMLQALAQFMSMLVSANSRYDHYVRNEPNGTLSSLELTGLEVFRSKCANCHASDLFTDHTYRNNGILNDFSVDKGRNEVSSLPEDVGKFRVPSLRNVALTAPYMHNGKFKTLESVLEHYASGVKNSPTLDPLLNQNGQLGIPLTDGEKQALLAFLETLTDQDFARDERFRP